MHITLFIAFAAGLVSFLAPCVLPLIPGFLAYLAGAQLSEASAHRKEMFFNSAFFVLGFALVFAVLGVALNTILKTAAYGVQAWLSRLGGALIIFFGLYLTGLITIPFFEREHKIVMRAAFLSRLPSRYLTSVLFGAAFAVGWSPCVGPALGAILALAATAPGRAFSLLMSYALGLGIPFLLVGLFAAPASAFIKRSARSFAVVNTIFGAILIILGILVFTQNLSLIANWELLNRVLLR